MSVLEALESSIRGAEWLVEADSAAIELGRCFAAAIDEATGDKVSYLGPSMLKVLDSLLLTPSSRGRRHGKDAPAANVVDELELMRKKRRA